MYKKIVPAITLTACAVIASQPASAGVTYKKDDGSYVKFGGRIQLQYNYTKPDGGSGSDTLFFRRLRPYIEGSVHKDWKGKFQFDLGKASGDNEVSIKDAFMEYKGYDNMKVAIGNKTFPFSREQMTSSKKQQLVERTFVGDHNYGSADRNLGVHLSGNSEDDKMTWGAAVAMAAIDPDDDKLDFDTPANKSSDWNEGMMVGGRVDFHPMGKLKFSQGDFKGKQKATIGVAAFTWSNDDDNNNAGAGKADVDNVTALELSGAYRNSGLSVDVQFNSFDAETVDPSITSGIYVNGETKLTNAAIEGGYMIVDKTTELVFGYQTQDADGYADAWTRTSVGVNWYLHKHDIKVQATYRMSENLDGAVGSDEDELFVQTQYVF